MQRKISHRVRPNSEAAPWVCDEIITMEEEIVRLRAELARVQPIVDAAERFVAMQGNRGEVAAWDTLTAAIDEAKEGV